MNLPTFDFVQVVMTVLCSTTAGGGLVAWINRKPQRVVLAEASKIEADAEEAMATVRLRATEEWERLFARFRAEMDAQDIKIATLKTEGHRLRNFASALQGFGAGLLRHIDAQDDYIKSIGGTPLPRPPLVLPTLDTTI